MSAPIQDGGPAFPVHPQAHNCGDREYVALAGMSLRDYFAAHAPPPPPLWRPPVEKHTYEDIIDWHWFYADRMIERRQA